MQFIYHWKGVICLIQVKNVTKCYGNKEVLKDITFSAPEGQVVGLLGLNGAGKTTTMNIITGYISASSGTVSIDGYDIMSNSREAKLVTGYLPEQPSFYPELRVEEHLDFICDLKSVTKNKAERKKHIDNICQRVGIADVKKRMVRNLSKGYRQRVGFAQALIGNPKIIILDEPTVGLDPSQIIDIRKLIKEVGKTSTVIVSSHILSEIQAVSDRVIIIHNGQIIADDSTDHLSKQLGSSQNIKARIVGEPDNILSVLGEVNGIKTISPFAEMEPNAWDYIIEVEEDNDVREAIFRTLAKADLPLLSFYGAEQSLEEAFLNLTTDKPSDDKEEKQQ